MEMVKSKGEVRIVGVLGIFAIYIFAAFAFSPFLFLNYLINKELAFLIFYVIHLGGVFLVVRSIFGFQGNTFKFESIEVILLLLFVTFAIQIGISGPITDMIPMPDFMKELFLSMSKTDIYSFITIVIAAPILEEFLFRGIVLKGLLKRYSPTKAIIVSAIFFGIAHLNPWQFVTATMIGLFMGWVYYKTHNIMLTMIMHMGNNLVGFLLMLAFDQKEMMDKTISEVYGGNLNYILIIIGALALGAFSFYHLYKEFDKRKIITETIDNIEV
ncbi:MAG: type II CAAX endopeptidase family protein [Salinivirgaceae bacterium]|nr:type II CAAX endopeptidase family protein [Salinivirgaceae bacterium]MDD4746126.1 type II CAAX endopeptidase family protein [Salinivirgaceae bacterium]MDY0279842.1 type II CAAX endopeptidase family protein [Salinivirgaceae bacterium]